MTEKVNGTNLRRLAHQYIQLVLEARRLSASTRALAVQIVEGRKAVASDLEAVAGRELSDYHVVLQFDEGPLLVIEDYDDDAPMFMPFVGAERITKRIPPAPDSIIALHKAVTAYKKEKARLAVIWSVEIKALNDAIAEETSLADEKMVSAIVGIDTILYWLTFNQYGVNWGTVDNQEEKQV